MANIAVFLSTTGWGGLEMNTLKLTLGLKKYDHTTVLFAVRGCKLYNEAQGKVDNLISLAQPKKYFDFNSAKAIAMHFKQENIEVVLVPDNRDIDVLSWVKRLYYKKLKLVYHQNMQIGIKKKDLIHALRYKAIDCWISPLQWLKEEVVRNTRFPGNKIEVIPIGTDITKHTKRKYEKSEARKKLGLKTNTLLVGIIGRISEKKGQAFVIEAFDAYRKTSGENIELLVFGSATINDEACQAYEKKILKYVKDSNLEEVVHFSGFNPESELFYNAIDIFTIASESETYGMVTIEAMLSGLPILAADTGGSPEILENNKLGTLYSYGNKKDFSKKLKYVVNNFEITQKMANKAQKKAIKEYDQETEFSRISDIIKHVLS